jgi:hypothetical protein
MAVVSDTSSAHPRFRRSEVIRGLDWSGGPERFPGSGSDMHWYAWGSDDALYIVDDDGRNFGNEWNFAHLLRVTGTPPDHTVEEISRFPDLVRPDGLLCRRYVDGALAVDGRLYVAAYDYADEVPGFDDFWVIDHISDHGGVAAFMYSDDRGVSWHNVPGTGIGPDDYVLGPRFAGLAFVGFGPGCTGVPERLGDYVYAVSNDGNWETGDNAFLARVPRDAVLDSSAWEFYCTPGEGAFDAPATWTREEYRARPILRDPGRIGHPTMTYLPALDRFLLTYSTEPVPHTFGTPTEVAKATWDRSTELLVLEAPNPWGPWRLVHHDPAWESPHTPYLPQVPQKWLDADGLGGWMVHSGDYTDPEFQDWYGFMTRRFRLTPA